jgi:hypothetical protein
MPWTKVTNRKDGKVETNEDRDSTMKKVQVTLTIRSSKNNDFNPAKLHIDMLHELHKFDDSLIIFNTTGDSKVNIESPILESHYKKLFKPMEKAHNSGIVTVSISHYILLTENAGRCKEAIFPFIKKNKIFIYFNPKPGLEHFMAIGILFGPNPDYIWRDELADLLIEAMKAEITQDEQGKIGTNDDGKPKLLLSLNTQTLGINKPVTTTTVALKIRVPTGQERIYTNILERLYKKSEEEEIIIPSKLGNFFFILHEIKNARSLHFYDEKTECGHAGYSNHSHFWLHPLSTSAANYHQRGNYNRQTCPCYYQEYHSHGSNAINMEST